MKKRNRVPQKIQAIDLSYLRAATILARQAAGSPITIMQVGCGGTGSYLAQHIGRVLSALKEVRVPARAFFIDHDRVEKKNIGRQLFCDAEIGRNKAETLALRFGSAWGLDITAVPARFSASMVNPNTNELIVLVGCVDNAAARKEMSQMVGANRSDGAPNIWWLDCGNHEEAGQVLLGSALTADQMKGAFPSREICQSVPAPSIQSPELLVPKKEEKARSKMSCAELAAANVQSLNINSRIAAEASDMLTRLLVTRNLKRFACELNLAAGVCRSTYATAEDVMGFFEKRVKKAA